MKKKDKYGNIDHEDLLRYIKGDLSDKERHALEREIQKDLFASEALDGLSNHRIEEVREDLDRLESRLNKRVKNRRSLTWVRIAASVAVIVTIGTLYFTVFTDMIDRTDRMAVETESQEPARDESAMDVPKGPARSETPGMESRTYTKTMDDALPEGGVKEEIQENRQGTTAESEPVKSSEISTPDEEFLISESSVPDEEVLADAIQGESDTIFESDVEVTDQQIEFLVVEEETEQILAEEFAYESVAAQSSARSMDIARPAAISESPAREVSGVQESRLAAKKLSGSLEKSQVLSAIILSESTRSNPVGGIEIFRKYVTGNLAYPMGESMDEMASVILSFNVGSTGRPRDIIVIESSGEVFSREAIRVLEAGPDWVTVQDEIRLQINFIPE